MATFASGGFLRGAVDHAQCQVEGQVSPDHRGGQCFVREGDHGCSLPSCFGVAGGRALLG
jgi:hypothetical protein